MGEAPGAQARAQLAAIAAMEPVLDESRLAHWEDHGYVVLPEAISAEQAAAVSDLIWETTGAAPDDPTSWYGAREDGIMVARFQHPALEAARRSPRIHKAFSQLWGTENLWVTIDRMGFNPPVTPDHPFAGSDLHWDVSLAQPIPFGTQAVMYLSDTAVDQGAFRCVPGFHHEIAGWLDRLGDADPRKIDLSAREVHVAGKAGDLVIWRQDLPHGASPNHARSPRLAQYLNYYLPDMEVRRRWR
jgi:ectoine hydroxylase-related dioxygenase (phytanoyl-CoA dioxygenase family)